VKWQLWPVCFSVARSRLTEEDQPVQCGSIGNDCGCVGCVTRSLLFSYVMILQYSVMMMLIVVDTGMMMFYNILFCECEEEGGGSRRSQPVAK